MNLYFLTYDLRNGKDYSKIYAELEKYKAVRILNSTWCFRSYETDATALREHFTSYIDGDDGLIISQVKSWASIRTDGNPNQLK